MSNITNGQPINFTQSEYNEIDPTGDEEKIKLPRDANVLLDDILKHRDWEKRSGQIKMVESIHSAIVDSYPGATVDVSVNAPVGTGKSLGYIVAGLAAGKRMIVATSTKSLQDQLIKEELPQLKEDLKAIYGYDLKYSMLKGKSNYPCLSSVRAMLQTGDAEDLMLFDDLETPDTRDLDTLREMVARAEKARETGNILEYDAEALMGRLQPDTRRNIVGSKNCAAQKERWLDVNKMKNLPVDFEFTGIDELPEEIIHAASELPAKIACSGKCIYRSAYAHAMDAQIVVINTTLLAYELIKADSITSGESLNPYLLKGIDMLVVDEAHHLFRILAEAFSVELNITKSMDLIDEITKKLVKRYGDDPLFSNYRNSVLESERAINDIIDEDTETENEFRTNLSAALLNFGGISHKFVEQLQTFASRHEMASPSGLALDKSGCPKVVSAMGAQISEDIIDNASKLAEQLDMVDSENKHQFSLNFSDANQPLVIKSVPIDVSFFRKMVSRTSQMPNIYTNDVGLLTPASVILSSGTISKQTPIVVGMKTENYVNVESPFDPERVRIYIPKNLGVPRGRDDRDWAHKAWREFADEIVKLGGRTLILTTSHQKCEEFTNIARESLPFDFKVFSQKDRGMGKGQLISSFKSEEKAVLIGTTSFWEGVDIPGDDLNLVVIEKLPFPQPNDPIFNARREFVKERDGNPFMEVDVDYASVMLAQGTGRLIRSTKDIGGIVILDDRVITKRYSQAIVSLLPSEWLFTQERKLFSDWISKVNPSNRKEPFNPGDTNGWNRVVNKPLQRRRILPKNN